MRDSITVLRRKSEWANISKGTRGCVLLEVQKRRRKHGLPYIFSFAFVCGSILVRKVKKVNNITVPCKDRSERMRNELHFLTSQACRQTVSSQDIQREQYTQQKTTVKENAVF